MTDTPVCFIVGSPKSGTSLLQSLLDNHDELFVMLPELRYFQHKGLPSITFQHSGWSYIHDYSIRDNVESIKSQILEHKEFTSLRSDTDMSPPRNISTENIDVDLFYETVEKSTPNDDADLVLTILKAMASCSDYVDDVSNRMLIENTPLQEEFASVLEHWFPSAKFIHIIRNPYALFSSLKNRITRRGIYPDIKTQITDMMEASYYYHEKNKQSIEDYYTLNYDSLLRNPNKEMKQIANYLNVEFTESLLQPTTAGVPWGGNSMHDDDYSGISKKPLTNWKEDLTEFEIQFVNDHFSTILHKYYEDEMITVEPFPLWPQRNESLKRYVLNRLAYCRA